MPGTDVDDRAGGRVDAVEQIEQLEPGALPNALSPAGRRTRPWRCRTDRPLDTTRRLDGCRLGGVDAATCTAPIGDSSWIQRASFCPGRRSSWSTERFVRAASAIERIGHLVGRVERMLALGTALQLAHRLFATQHQHREQRRRGRIEHECLGEHVAVLGRPVGRAVDRTCQAPLAQRCSACSTS